MGVVNGKRPRRKRQTRDLHSVHSKCKVKGDGQSCIEDHSGGEIVTLEAREGREGSVVLV